MPALRGTASPKLREAATLQKWNAIELVDNATEFESSTKATQQHQKNCAVEYGVDKEPVDIQPNHIGRVGGRYSKQNRQASINQRVD